MMRADDSASRSSFEAFQSRLQPSAEAVAALRELGRALKRSLPKVETGQVWRAVWDGESVVGALLEIDEGFAMFAPITVDVDHADPFTAVLAVEESPLPVSVAVFVGLATPVPLFTLQACVGEVGPPAMDDCLALWRASVIGQIISTGRSTGGLAADGVEARRELYNQLSFQLARIAMAELEDEADSDERVSLPDLLRKANLSPSRLVRLLDVDLADARAIAGGHGRLTLAQADRLAAELDGIEALDLVRSAEPLPESLKQALNDPERFKVVRKLAADRDIDLTSAAQLVPSLYAARRQDVERDDVAFWTEILDKLGRGD
ncbi:hypothetical protein ACFWN2_25825 [Lentzea sp. NPDC058436]|uniref:hypothetical protein n=1 Tax=Lentzea sp. NPDC058436 TaxID=3346499 RepID=UPI003666969E